MAQTGRGMRFECEQPFVGEQRCVTRQERLRVSGHSLLKDPPSFFSLQIVARVYKNKNRGGFIDRKHKEVGVGKGGIRQSVDIFESKCKLLFPEKAAGESDQYSKSQNECRK